MIYVYPSAWPYLIDAKAELRTWRSSRLIGEKDRFHESTRLFSRGKGSSARITEELTKIDHICVNCDSLGEASLIELTWRGSSVKVL